MNFSSSGAVFRWKPAAWLRVTGSDAATFLQGQFTNDLRGLATGEARYGLWLNVKGKVVAESFVLKGEAPDEFWLGSYASPAAVLRERLDAFVIADDVVIEDETTLWTAWSLFGLDAPVSGVARPSFVFAGRRGQPATELVVRAADAPKIEASLTAVPSLSAEDILRIRIEAGIPAIPTDIGLADLPNEAALDEEAISFTKGCYLGQEVMARLKSMGQVRRRLLRVRGTSAVSAAPSTPHPLFVGPKQVGELRSIVRGTDGAWRGLAMVTLMHLTPGASLSLEAGGPGLFQPADAP